MLLAIDQTGLFFLITFLILVVIFLGIFIPFVIVNSKYKSFVLKHSQAINTLNEINKRYQFRNVSNMNMVHSYDNEIYYSNISCRDYLIYQLVYCQKKVTKAIKNAYYNKDLLDNYNNEIESTCVMEHFDTEELLRNKSRLRRTERRIFNNNIKKPVTSFSITVRLNLTRINGHLRTGKTNIFKSNEINDLIYKINQKEGAYYLNDYIWQAICRVERGKVTNKVRFAVYSRDNYRCRICGRKTNDLEVDHIYPISKGGKTTFDNLQTLCHRCNMRKGSNVY